MKTLEEIRKEIGNEEYKRMELKAELELSNHPEFWERASAWRSLIYESIIKQYQKKNSHPQTKPDRVKSDNSRHEMKSTASVRRDKTADDTCRYHKERRYMQL